MKISRRKFLLTLGTSLIAGFLIDSFWFERYIYEVNIFSHRLRKSDPTPLRIIQISDMHLNSVGYLEKQIIRKIKELSPDLICFTGDSVDKEKGLALLDKFLQLLPASIPKVAILGNWEHMASINISKLKNIYKKNNGLLLINDSAIFSLRDKNITFTGTDEHMYGKPDFEKALKDTKSQDLHIFMCHSPGYADEVRKKLTEKSYAHLKVDLILSGHTHGGQLNFFGFIPYLPIGSGTYIKGWYRDQTPPLYVSKGIGTSILPLRFGARAEITVFDFN